MDKIDIAVDVMQETDIFESFNQTTKSCISSKKHCKNCTTCNTMYDCGDDTSLNTITTSTTSADIKKLATKIRLMHAERYKDSGIRTNADLINREIEMYCQISEDALEIVSKYDRRFGLSLRGYTRVLKVARTIADIEGFEKIQKTT